MMFSGSLNGSRFSTFSFRCAYCSTLANGSRLRAIGIKTPMPKCSRARHSQPETNRGNKTVVDRAIFPLSLQLTKRENRAQQEIAAVSP